MDTIIYAPFLNYLKIAGESYEKITESLNKNDGHFVESQEFHKSIDSFSTIVVVFTVISLESYIYNYATRKLGNSFSKKHLESLNLYSKWVIIPNLVNGNSIPKDHKGLVLLKKLIKIRNAVIHLKAKNIEIDHFDQQIGIIRESNLDLKETALNSFHCVGQLRKALHEIDKDEHFALLLSKFLEYPLYKISKIRN